VNDDEIVKVVEIESAETKDGGERGLVEAVMSDEHVVCIERGKAHVDRDHHPAED
jgi:hypothetical protein